MSQNIQQIFVANPASSMVSTDLLYLGRSPYGPTDDFAITFANFVASIGTATPTASTIPRWDAHVNMSANNFLAGFASTATAAATTTLTVSSAYNQYFTGSTTQTVVLPVTSTLALGFPFRIINNSTGVVTVQSSGANTIQAMAPGSTLLLTCILISGTTAASWDAQYIIAADVSGAVLLAPSGAQTILTYPLNLPGGMYTPEIFDSNGNAIVGLSTTATSVNYLQIKNAATTTGPILSAIGSDTNIALGFSTKGVGIMSFTAANVANQFVFTTYTAGACTNIFNFPGTSGTLTYTFPATSGTLALAASSAETFNGDSGSATPSAGVITFTGASTGLTFAGSGSTMTLSGTLISANGGTGVTSVTTVPAATHFAGWDASKNLSANSFISSYATTVTAAATTTLTVASAQQQYFTGSTTQIVAMPVVTTLVLGQQYQIVNLSSGAVTVNSSGGNPIVVLAANTDATITCVAVTGTTAASWSIIYGSESGEVISVAGTANQVLVNGTSGTGVTGLLTLTLPQSIATSSSPTFTGLTLSAPLVGVTNIQDASGNIQLAFASGGGTPFNYLQVNNNPTGASPNLSALGGDTNVGINFIAKGTGQHTYYSTNSTPFLILSGTAYQHTAAFAFANTATNNLYTFPDGNGTVQLQNQSLGNATATSLTFSPSTGGIVGTTTNDNANVGDVGHIYSSVIPIGSAVSLSSGASQDLTSLNLPAGDYDVWGNVGFFGGPTTNVSFTLGWINTVSATPPDASLYCGINYGAAGLVIFGNGVSTGFCVPGYRMSLASPTTIYLTADSSFTISTCTAFGGIYARVRR